MALWGGRFTQGPDQRFKDFNDSLKFDYRMAIEDIDGSVGWAKALCEVGVLTEKECADLQQALKDLKEEVSKDLHAVAVAGDEDIHSYVEIQTQNYESKGTSQGYQWNKGYCYFI